jgi:hypothetical protein
MTRRDVPPVLTGVAVSWGIWSVVFSEVLLGAVAGLCGVVSAILWWRWA